jgi:beta-carotene 3-hydroxylase
MSRPWQLPAPAGADTAARPGYGSGMDLFAGLLLLIFTIAAMEGVAWATHRFVMHGPGWFLHASHHRPRTGHFEANDWYAAVFAIPSVLLILAGTQLGWGDWAIWVGAGVAAYGLIYFGFHDVIVHQRVPHRFVARSTYLKRIVQAHRLHHAVETRQGAVSFGFLLAPRPERLKARLVERGRHGLRAPAAAED